MSKVVKGVKKVFKKIVSSKIFKVVLIAVAIYFGGAALGMWNSGFASVNGAWTAAGSQASQAAALQASGAAATGSTLQAGGGVLAAGNGGLATVAPTAGQSLAASVTPNLTGAATTTAGTAGSAAGSASSIAGKSMLTASANAPAVAAPSVASVAAPKVATKGIISRAMEAGGKVLETGGKTLKTVGTWAKENPALAQGLMNGISSAASPDEQELMERKYELEQSQDEQDRARRNENLNVGGLNSRMNTYDNPITWASTGQNVFQSGLISRRVGG
jgi:hypothetical protein